jgi:4-hydroxybenzoate polyprenyltransferase
VTVRTLVLASHPVPVVAVTVGASALTLAAGQTASRLAVFAAAVCTGQLSIGWLNDYLDRNRDLIAGRTDKPVATRAVRPPTVATAAVAAALACIPLSFALGPTAGVVHLVGVAAGWAYDLWLKSTLASWVAYAVGFGSLAAFATYALPGGPAPPLWLVAAGALLGVGAHVANVLPDIDDDLAAGVRGLPQRLGRPACRVLAPLLVLSAAAVATTGPAGPPGPGAVAGLAAVAAIVTTGQLARSARSRLPFHTTMVAALIAVLLLVGRVG